MVRQKIIEWLCKLLRVEMPKEYVDSVERVFSLEDDPTVIHVWKVKDDLKSVEVQNLINEMHTRFVQTNKRDPQAMHLVLNNIEDINTYSADLFEKQILPYLRTAKSMKGNR